MTSEGQHEPEASAAEPENGTNAWTRRAVLAAAAGGVATATVGGAVMGSTTAGAAAQKPWQHALHPRGEDIVRTERGAEYRFGLMFKKPAAYRPDQNLLKRLGATMTDPGSPPPKPGAPPAPPPASPKLDNPTVMAGYTFFGQFVDHDMTLDRRALSGGATDAKGQNFDSPKFDLQSVYGNGPGTDGSPELYESDGRRLKIAYYGAHEDLPRNGDIAMCGDARNDENLIIAQFHLLFLKFHNRCMADKRILASFAEAQRLTRWHFQWLIVNEFLPRIIDPTVLKKVVANTKKNQEFYKPKSPNAPMMPVEYSAAAYRFGHSMVRGAYFLNGTLGRQVPTFGTGASHLGGSRPLPSNMVIEWERFFDSSNPPADINRARRIDPRLAGPLFKLPATVVADGKVSLAERNLTRGWNLGLPSGQAVAREMGLKPITVQEFAKNAEDLDEQGLNQAGKDGMEGLVDVLRDPGWRGEVPLWFYVLAESKYQHRGEKLGTLGSTIVAEVIMGILNCDKTTSYINSKTPFRPGTPFTNTPGKFTVMDFVNFAKGK